MFQISLVFGMVESTNQQDILSGKHRGLVVYRRKETEDLNLDGVANISIIAIFLPMT